MARRKIIIEQTEIIQDIKTKSNMIRLERWVVKTTKLNLGMMMISI